jgi:hypothetical protein
VTGNGPERTKSMIARYLFGVLLCLVGSISFAIGSGRSATAADAAETEAINTLSTYYSAIDAYDYETAWNQLGIQWRKQQPLDDFTSGFTDTAFVRLDITNTAERGDDVTIAVRLTSWHNDKTIHGYSGTYEVSQEAGEWRLISANVRVSEVKQVVPPLCMLDDLTFRTDNWDAGAGNRFGELVATNISDRNCVVGGTPRVTVVVPGGKSPIAVSTGEAGSPPDAILLKPDGEASAEMRLANWCVEGGESLIVYVEVPGDTWKSEVGTERDLSIPQCLGDPEEPLFSIKGFVGTMPAYDSGDK